MGDIPDWMREALNEGYNRGKSLRDAEREAVLNFVKIIYDEGYKTREELIYKYTGYLAIMAPGIMHNIPLHIIWIDEFLGGQGERVSGS